MADLVWDHLDFACFIAAVVCVFGLKQLLLRKSRRASLVIIDAVILLIGIVAVGFVLQNATDGERLQFQKQIEEHAPAYAREMKRLGHEKITLNTPPDDPLYLSLIALQRSWQATDPHVADIYTIRKLPSGKNVVIVDSETDCTREGNYHGGKEHRTPIGQIYEVADPGLERAFHGEANFDPTPTTDRWGYWIAAWQPLYRADGSVEAVLGVDYNARDWLRAIEHIRLVVLALGGLSSIAFLSFTGWIALEWALRRRENEAFFALRRSEERLAAYLRQSPVAAIAHDFNNLLSAISGHSELLICSTEMAEIDRESASEIQRAARSASKLAARLLTIAKEQQVAYEPVDLNLLLQRSAKMFEPLLGHRIQTQLLLDPTLPPFQGAEIMIEQVIINLTLNARDAMPSGGKLTFSTTAVALTEGKTGTERRPGSYARFSLKDTGTGIAPEVIEKIFEPYFTTKPPGKGTGLGLASACNTLKEHNGWIDIESEVGKGTTFHLFFPLTHTASPALPR